MTDTIDIEKITEKMVERQIHKNGVEGLAELAALHKNGVEGLAELAAEPLAEPLDMIMRQTNYDKDIAQKKLTEHNNDFMQVIREYMMPTNQKPVCTTKLSVNQQVYKEIRGMMDDAAKKYELEKVKQTN